MDDERTLREAEARLRTVLAPDANASQRVGARALAQMPRRRFGAPRVRYALVAGVVLAVLTAGTWHWRRANITPALGTPALSLTVTGRDSLVIVDSSDGRRWVIGRPPERRRQGRYLIAVGN